MTDWKTVAKEAKARLAQIDAERQNLLGIVRHAEALAGLTPAVSGDAERPETPRTKARTGSTVTPTIEAVKSIIMGAGRPMETRDLLPLVRARGVEVGGKDAVATLSARLSNSGEFQNKRGIGWWFAGQAYPGAMSFEEAEGQSVEGQPSASNASKEGSDDAAALAHNVLD